MGFNTACIILNDRLHDFANDADVGAKVHRAVVMAHRDPNRGPHGFQALPPQHADCVQIVAVGGNRIELLGHGYWRDDAEALLRSLANQMGFRIVRKPSRDRDAAPRKAAGFEAEGQQPGPEGDRP